MPFVSDEQRKAAFARMGGRSNYGGGGGNSGGPTAPTPGTNPQYGMGAVGYAGNYTSGLPSYANWYNSLPNTTGAPPTMSPSGPWGIQYNAEDAAFDQAFNEGYLLWYEDEAQLPYGARELTTTEKILLGIPVAAAVAWFAPLLFAGTDLTLAAGGEIAIEATGSIFLAVNGTTGASFGYSALALTGIPMSVNDAPSGHVEGLQVVATYPDIATWVAAQLNN